MDINQPRKVLWTKAVCTSLLYLTPAAILFYTTWTPVSGSGIIALFVLGALTAAAIANPWIVRIQYQARIADGNERSEQNLLESIKRIAARAHMRHVPRIFVTPTQAALARMAGFGGRHGIVMLDTSYTKPWIPTRETDATIAHELGHLLTDYSAVSLMFTLSRALFIMILAICFASLLPDGIFGKLLVVLSMGVGWWLTSFGDYYISRCSESAADAVSVILTGSDALADGLLRDVCFDSEGKPQAWLGDMDFRTIHVVGPYDDEPGFRGRLKRCWYSLNSTYPPLANRVLAMRTLAATLC